MWTCGQPWCPLDWKELSPSILWASPLARCSESPSLGGLHITDGNCSRSMPAGRIWVPLEPPEKVSALRGPWQCPRCQQWCPVVLAQPVGHGEQPGTSSQPGHKPTNTPVFYLPAASVECTVLSTYQWQYINAAQMFLFSNSMGQDGLAITTSRSGALRVLLEVSMELRLISRSYVFSGSAWVIIFYIHLFLNRAVWYGMLCVCAGRETVGRSWPWNGSGHLQNPDYEDFEGFLRSLCLKLYV